MARKTVGYVELEWICPNCNAKNPGTKKVCIGCGSPQPDSVAFQRAEGEKLIEKEIEPSSKLPDIHCGFCGTRNPGGSTSCSQCSGDLSEGKKRASGQILGGFSNKVQNNDIQCAHCESFNPSSYQYCANCGASLAKPTAIDAPKETDKKKLSPIVLIIILIAAILGCALIISLLSGMFKRDTVNATVDQVSWQRTISIEEYGNTQKENWLSELPDGAEIIECEKRYHHTQDEPAPDSVEVCGTPYVVDQGSGVGEVIQDCKYEVQQDFCSYSIMDWFVIDKLSVDGYDTIAYWPETNLNQQQRIGEKNESYMIYFSDGNENYVYRTSDYDFFQQAYIGSAWNLTVNAFNDVVDIAP